MGLEESVAREELHKYTPDTPDITGETPAQIQNDFGGAVMPGRHDGRVVFIIEGGGAKINEPDLAIEKDSPLPGTAVNCGRRGGDGTVIGEGLVCVANKEDVFGFEVGMDEVQVMQD